MPLSEYARPIRSVTLRSMDMLPAGFTKRSQAGRVQRDGITQFGTRLRSGQTAVGANYGSGQIAA